MTSFINNPAAADESRDDDDENEQQQQQQQSGDEQQQQRRVPLHVCIYNVAKIRNVLDIIRSAASYGAADVLLVSRNDFPLGDINKLPGEFTEEEVEIEIEVEVEVEIGDSISSQSINNAAHESNDLPPSSEEERRTSNVQRIKKKKYYCGSTEVKIFRTFKLLVAYCKEERIHVAGIEIIDGAVNVEEWTMPKMLSDEKKSMNDSEGENGWSSLGLLMGNEGHGLNDKAIAFCDSFVKISHFGSGTARYVFLSLYLSSFFFFLRSPVYLFLFLPLLLFQS
jgi:hypothetical protein